MLLMRIEYDNEICAVVVAVVAVVVVGFAFALF